MIWLVMLAVLCTAGSQYVQALAARALNEKAAASGSSTATSTKTSTESPVNPSMLREPRVFLAYALLALGLLFWLIALTELEISQVYPLFAVGYIVTMLLARFGLGERLSARALAGSALIVAGGILCNL